MFVCVFSFRIIKQIFISVCLYGVCYKTYTCLATTFLSKIPWIPMYKSVCMLKLWIKIVNEEIPCRLLGSNQTPLWVQANALDNVLTMWIYMLAYTWVVIHNTIYLFNINSRKLDGHYRSWIEYLNERC